MVGEIDGQRERLTEETCHPTSLVPTYKTKYDLQVQKVVSLTVNSLFPKFLKNKKSHCALNCLTSLHLRKRKEMDKPERLISPIRCL